MPQTKRSRQDQRSSIQEPPKSGNQEQIDAVPTSTSPTKLLFSRHIADGPPAKRARFRADLDNGGLNFASAVSETSPIVAPAADDYISALSDELLIRILSCLPLHCLLCLALVSRRFHRLADDSQLWRAIYHDRFVLPRVLRVPRFRGDAPLSAAKTKTSAQDDTIEEVTSSSITKNTGAMRRRPNTATVSGTARDNAEVALPFPVSETKYTLARAAPSTLRGDRVLNWKQKYKLRHNWARGRCAVEELRLGGNQGGKGVLDLLTHCNPLEDEECGGQEHKIIVKVINGIAVTADWKRGLRVWDLKSRSLVVGTSHSRCAKPEAAGTDTSCDAASKDQAHDSAARSDGCDDLPRIPTALAADATDSGLDIAVGLLDGGFEIWQCDLFQKRLTRAFTCPASDNGSLTGIVYSHPYVLTATDSVLVSLYVFGAGRKHDSRAKSGASTFSGTRRSGLLNPPHLLSSLRSHTSRPPLALSIREMASVVVASIAYTLSTRQGWAIGIQDLHVKADDTGGSALPRITTTQLAYSLPINKTNNSKTRNNGRSSSSWTSSSRNTRQAQRAPFSGSPRSRMYAPDMDHPSSPQTGSSDATPTHHRFEDQEDMDGPIALCYSHPYLLATMPDNTLILHLCTSNASSLAISPGVRLWGHTSRISDAKITARGKAVSVSMRGDEMRVWELEGRPAAGRGQSVTIRPNAADRNTVCASRQEGGGQMDGSGYDWNERRNWVGFDDEMVIVLKQSHGGQESLLVYDFT